MSLNASEHYYLSTACLHQQHSYCKATVNLCGEHKKPAECKYCAAPCICPCHHGEPVPEPWFSGDE